MTEETVFAEPERAIQQWDSVIVVYEKSEGKNVDALLVMFGME